MSAKPLRASRALLWVAMSGVAGASLWPVLASAATIDVLVVYTQGVEDRYGGDPSTRFDHLLNVANQVYVDSNVDLNLRMAAAVKVNYPDAGSANTALNDITNAKSVFANIENLRTLYGADMVLFYRTYQSTHGSCGLAWVNAGSNGNMSATSTKRYMYAHVGIDACPDHTTVHELGHNMGLNHSRLQDKKGGAFPYALGYGVAGKFTDVMAYTSAFKVDYWTGTVYKLSNPTITCRGLPCGVDRTKPDGADAAFAVNLTGPQIANYYGDGGVAANSEVTAAQARVTQAEQARNDAVAARDAQLIIANQAAAALTKAKAAVDAAKKEGGKSLTTYKTKLAAIPKETQALEKLQTKLSTAQAKYDAAATDAARTRLAKEVAAAEAALAKQQTKLDTLQSDVAALGEQLSGVIAALEAGTQALTEATDAAKTEKAKYTELVKAATAAETAYKAAKADYNKLLKSKT